MRNLSMIMSLNSNHIIEYEIYEEPIDSYKFYNFINRIIKKLNQDGYTFIFDNVSFHYNKEMLKLIQNSNNYVLFTPPYSPDFNPIENVFGIIKNLYRKKYNNISFKNKTFTVKEQINIIESSILDFITIHYINIDKIINRSINFSYEEIENECYLKYR